MVSTPKQLDSLARDATFWRSEDVALLQHASELRADVQRTRQILHLKMDAPRKELAALRVNCRGEKDSHMKNTAIKSDPQVAEVEFLRSELTTGLTLSKIALDADQQDKAERNRVNAKKAYDTVLRFIPRVSLSREETSEIKSKLAQLRAALERLGEPL